MRIANVHGRVVLVNAAGRALDIEQASGGLFGADPQALYPRWAEFRRWARETGHETAVLAPQPFEPEHLGSPAPLPRQVFCVGLNYRDHAAESGFAVPDTLPPVFTKYVSSITGPVSTVSLPEGGHTDWEVELVVVVGKTARHIEPAHAWDHVAGLTAGQDLSERITQLQGPAPQFGLGKSFPGFSAMGPYLVTPDEFTDPDSLELGCSVNGVQVQKGRTGDLIFSVPVLLARLSAILTLLPGDVVFTGTPSGVGMGRSPQQFLATGDVLVSYVEGIGELRQTFTAA
ncbi:fumarylacetoacetate hydrolase family protein [Streptomyces sp. NPDC008092]|uniref:fumarylacetoacetate hydrolase family protein n=1 Tax=Streptomyces sp. NPDC008092 TaxID=3364808 RepID=UPI0036F02397